MVPLLKQPGDHRFTAPTTVQADLGACPLALRPVTVSGYQEQMLCGLDGFLDLNFGQSGGNMQPKRDRDSGDLPSF